MLSALVLAHLRLKFPETSLFMYPSQYLSNKAVFQTPFIGDLKPFCDRIDDCYKTWRQNPGKWLAPYLPVVQSSGTGKTRQIIELARQEGRWLVYLNFSPPLRGSSAHLTEQVLTWNVIEWECFFLATCAVMNAIKCRPLPEDFEEYFAEITQTVKERIEKSSPSKGNGQRICTPGDFFGLSQVDNFASQFYKTILACDQVIDQGVPPCCVWRGKEPLIIALDGARVLLNEQNFEKSAFRSLMRSLSLPTLRDLGFFVICADSDPRIAALPRPPEKELFSPWILTDFLDRFPEKMPETLGEVCSTDYLTGLGRPIWRFEAPKPCFVQKTAEKVGEDAKAIACLGPRLAIRTHPCHTNLIRELVANYRYVLFGLEQSDLGIALLHAFYPSEPSQVAASYAQMAANFDTLLVQIDQISSMIERGICPDDQYAARLAFLLAWDSLFLEQGPGKINPWKPFQQKTVGDFLGKLVSNEELGKLTGFEAIFDGKMVFTHFAQCNRQLEHDPDQIVDLMVRTAGGCFPQSSLSFVLPFLLPGKEDPSLFENLSLIGVSVRTSYVDDPETEQKLLEHSEFYLREQCKLGRDRGLVCILFAPNSSANCVETRFDENDKKCLKLILRGIGSLAYLADQKLLKFYMARSAQLAAGRDKELPDSFSIGHVRNRSKSNKNE